MNRAVALLIIEGLRKMKWCVPYQIFMFIFYFVITHKSSLKIALALSTKSKVNLKV